MNLISRLFGNQPEPNYEIADIYRDLRDKVFNINPAAIGLNPASTPQVWGMLMETGFPEAVATLLTLADGTVSLYFSNGGGIIGVGQHEEPNKAAREFLASAGQFLGEAKPSKERTLPSIGRVKFYFFTFNGIFAADASDEGLANNVGPLSPLFFKGHDVITAARLAEKKIQADVSKMLDSASTGDTATLQKLLATGLKPSLADHTGLTPLMAAAYSGKMDCVSLLLKAGAKVDAIDEKGYTALMFACNAGRDDCVVLLVEGGADVNMKDNDDSTPLMFAAQYARNNIVRYLMGCGADPSFKGKHGMSPILFARQNGHVETEAILTKNA